MKSKNKKIIMGMSGGVDSSMSLVILKNQGWRPIGVCLKLPVWKNKKNLLRENICCTKESLNTVRNVCQKLKVPYHVVDVRADFKKKVIDYFILEFKKNKTPNPCIICNRYFKFANLFAFAKKNGIKYVATGHYARTRKFQAPNSKLQTYQLLKAKDKTKDQTYSLCFLTQDQLKHIVFPLGNYTKKEVYEIAKKRGFDFFLKKKESQDFCFVAGKSFPAFLKEKVGQRPGKIVDSKGKVLGKHQGQNFYTIGQRKGLRIADGPWFVKDFEIDKNILIISKKPEEITKKNVILSPFNFISSVLPKKKLKVMAKIRYRQPEKPAILYPQKAGKLKLIFDQPQKAVTPGQFAVFYKNKACLGGGIIL